MTPQESREAPPAVELEIVPEAKTSVVKLRGEHDLSTKPRISEDSRSGDRTPPGPASRAHEEDQPA
jgi:hypothetical protein